METKLGPRGAQEWETPGQLFAQLDLEFGFTVDAAAGPANALCDRFWTIEDDGLTQCWDDETVWCNPPFSEAKAWAAKASASRGTSVLLVPAAIDTRWWHESVVQRAAEVRFVKGRIRFLMGGVPAPTVLPHAMAVVVWYGDGAPDAGPWVSFGLNWPGREPGSWVSR